MQNGYSVKVFNSSETFWIMDHFTSFWSYNYNTDINLTKKEQFILNNLSNNKNIVMRKLD